MIMHVAQALSRYKGFATPKMLLTVDSDDVSAIGFYNNKGFVMDPNVENNKRFDVGGNDFVYQHLHNWGVVSGRG